MDKLVIKGGISLKGEVKISGAKNAALPLMTLPLLATKPIVLENVPALQDVQTLMKLLEHLGVQVNWQREKRRLELVPPSVSCLEAPYDLVRTMRASVLVLGPLCARFGKARVSLPGGCAIGARPIDQHLKGLKKMGAEINISHGYVECTAKELVGARLVLDFPTVTGVENLMMAATLAKGTTLIENAAREPEVVELADALIAMGAKISGAGTSKIEIEGVDSLGGLQHEIRPDRIEAGTFMAAAAMTEGDVLVKGASTSTCEAVISKMRTMGVVITEESEGLRVQGPNTLEPCQITTQPFPGFPTDMQAQFMAMATGASGQSKIKESIFENRFMHVPELVRMGADISVDGRTAWVKGKSKLTGTTVMATDLRASAGLVLAGLVADGETHVRRVYHLDRGYESLESKLSALGADVVRVKD